MNGNGEPAQGWNPQNPIQEDPTPQYDWGNIRGKIHLGWNDPRQSQTQKLHFLSKMPNHNQATSIPISVARQSRLLPALSPAGYGADTITKTQSAPASFDTGALCFF